MEFTLVSVLLTALTLAVMQLGLMLYVRNSVIDAAASGARVAARADQSFEDGRKRTLAVIGERWGADYAAEATVQELSADHVRVTVRTRLPLLGLWGPPHASEVTADAVRERVPA